MTGPTATGWGGLPWTRSRSAGSGAGRGTGSSTSTSRTSSGAARAKTRVVYCKDSGRRGSHEHTSFTFLGYTFRPRGSRNSRTGRNFTSFSPAISQGAPTAKSAEIRSWRIHRRTGANLDDLAHMMNPIVRGWMNYWGRFNRAEMYPLLRRINAYLMKWARKKYRRLRGYKRARAWWKMVTERGRGLFAHWAWIQYAWMAG